MTQYPGLRNKVVLLTGGANGIGAATVRAFSTHGAKVFFCDTDSESGHALSDQLENVNFSSVDLSKPPQIARWIQKIGRSQPQIHVLVNNAAIDPRIDLHAMSAADWDRIFQVNLRAIFLASQAAAPHMPPGSAIVNFSSITFHTAPAHMSAYVATKAGIIGFTRSLARELGPRRIRVNALSPGWIMTARQLRDYVNAETKKIIRRMQSIPDLIEPEEIADVVLFLASDSSRAITGQEILADHGWAHS